MQQKTRTLKPYLRPTVEIIGARCEGILCNSLFGNNSTEDMYIEQELLPGDFEFI